MKIILRIRSQGENQLAVTIPKWCGFKVGDYIEIVPVATSKNMKVQNNT